MKFSVAPEIFEKFPELNIAVISARGINNRESEEAARLLEEQIAAVKAEWSLETISKDPRLLAWTEAYRSFGAKPKKYKCSVENLCRMIVKDVELGSINPIVDIYNAASLKYLIPMGGDDLNKIDGDIQLTIADGVEEFVQLNSSDVSYPKPGEVIYRDNKDVLCRRWNWRECDKSKMTQNSTNVSLVVEGLAPFTEAQVSEIANELVENVNRICGGSSSLAIINSVNPVAEI